MKSSDLVDLEHARAPALPIQRHQPVRSIDQRARQGDVGRALPEPSGDLDATFASAEAALNEERELKRLEAFSLLVLDHLVIRIDGVIDVRRNFSLAGKPRGPEPARAEVQDPALRVRRMRSYRYRLAYAALRDGLSQFLQRPGVKLQARLLGALVNALDE